MSEAKARFLMKCPAVVEAMAEKKATVYMDKRNRVVLRPKHVKGGLPKDVKRALILVAMAKRAEKNPAYQKALAKLKQTILSKMPDAASRFNALAANYSGKLADALRRAASIIGG